GGQTITINSLTAPASGFAYCGNEAAVLDFNASGFQAAPTQTFKVELSDASGNFPIMGSANYFTPTASGPNGNNFTIAFNMPLLPALGTGYRIRIVADPEGTASAATSPFTINPDAAINPVGNQIFCNGTSVNI